VVVVAAVLVVVLVLLFLLVAHRLEKASETWVGGGGLAVR